MPLKPSHIDRVYFDGNVFIIPAARVIERGLWGLLGFIVGILLSGFGETLLNYIKGI